MSDAEALPVRRKLAVGLRIWLWFLAVHLELRRRPLPDVVGRLAGVGPRPAEPLDPERAGRIVRRVLAVGPLDPRCLITALVLFRLLRSQGDAAELVIGMPATPTSKDAHAWVEVGGRDVGPPPGRAQHRALARYG